jgi:hypothetical protein
MENLLHRTQENFQHEMSFHNEQFTVSTQDSMDRFNLARERLKAQISGQFMNISKDREDFENQIKSSCQEREEVFQRAVSNYRNSIASLKADIQARIEIYVDNIESAVTDQIKMKRKYEKIVEIRRPQDIDKIESLQLILHAKTTHLADLMKELAELKNESSVGHWESPPVFETPSFV